MRSDSTYVSNLARSWRVPACGLLVVLTHLFVEARVEAGATRGYFILISFFLNPLVVSAFVRERTALWAAAVNGTYAILRFAAHVAEENWRFRIENNLLEFAAVLAFGLACGFFAGNFYRRLAARLGFRPKTDGTGD